MATLTSYESDNADVNINGVNNNHLAQSWQTSLSGYKLTTVQIYMKKTGSPTGAARLNIYGAGSDPQAGTLLSTSVDVAAASISTSAGYITFDFTSQLITISASTQYYLVLKQADDGEDASNFYTWRYQDTTGAYADGIFWRRTAVPAWVSDSLNDYRFIISGEAPVTNKSNMLLMGVG